MRRFSVVGRLAVLLSVVAVSYALPLKSQIKPEDEKAINQIARNKFGREILASLQQQLLRNTNNVDQILDIMNELEFDIFQDSLQDQQNFEKEQITCQEQSTNLTIIVNKALYNVSLKGRAVPPAAPNWSY